MHGEAMKAARPGMKVRVEALNRIPVPQERRVGSGLHPIVCGGANATVLHYINNAPSCGPTLC